MPAPTVNAQSGIPEISEEVVVALHPFDGRNYLQATFSHADRDQVYFLADSPSFVRFLKTLVYYWPLTDEWRTDTETLNHTFNGVMMVEDARGESQRVEQTPYTYYSLLGRYEGEVEWRIATGDDAYRELGKLKEMVAEFNQARSSRARRAAVLQDQFNELLYRISEAREQGRPIEELVGRAESINERIGQLRRPPPAPWEDVYDTPPERVYSGFVLELPAGQYSFYVEDEKGRMLEGSRKQLRVFEPTRTQQVGYELLPGDSYTERIPSPEANSVIYTDGTTEFYVKSFYQNEYNDLYFGRMTDQDARGNPNVQRWVRVQELENAPLVVEAGASDARTLPPQDFRVIQTPSASLGYTIAVQRIAAGTPDAQPTFRAVRVGADEFGDRATLTVRLPDGSRAGQREIRTVEAGGAPLVATAVSLLPIGCLVILRVVRGRMVSRRRMTL